MEVGGSIRSLPLNISTTGGSFREHVESMINGYDEVELTPGRISRKMVFPRSI